jgi:SAM-dependent methyltransferase
MPPAPRSAAYFDQWYADQAATPVVAEIMSRHMGFPRDLRAGVVAAEAIVEMARELRLGPGDTLLDLACGRGAYGLLVARDAGARVIGVDFSVQAVREASEQAARLWADEAEFGVGDLADCGLPDASVEAVLCTDAIQFAGDPAAAYAEIHRVLRPGARVVLTSWEPVDRDDERLSPRMRAVDLATGLAGAGFTGSGHCGKRPPRSTRATTRRSRPSATRPSGPWISSTRSAGSWPSPPRPEPRARDTAPCPRARYRRATRWPRIG